MPTRAPFRLRSALLGLTLFLGTAAFTLWQNAHIAVLWDLAYLLDSAWRFSLGQLPYRDVPFAHAPLTFVIQAEIIHLFGRVYWHTVFYAAFASGIATLLTRRIALKLLPARPLLAGLICAPLVPLGIYSIYPHPIYDADCILSVLLALYLLQRAKESVPLSLIAGAACVLPLFFKQNIGLMFLLITLVCVAVITLTRALHRERISPQLAIFAGAAVALAAALLTLHLTVGLDDYLYWTITFATQRRLPGLALILGIYRQPSLLWTVPAAIAALFLLFLVNTRSSRPERAAPSRETPVFVSWIACTLLAAPFFCAAVTFFLSDDPSDRTDALLSLWPHLLVLAALFALFQLRRRPTLVTLLPIILLATIHGSFLSQQLWGSTYALWPLLVLLLVLMLRELSAFPRLTTALAITITAVFFVCGSLYALSLDRLSYNHLDGPLAHATLPSLRGMAAPGPYLPDFEQLVRTTDTLIPRNDGILLLPGQEPFYFATGRTPQFPVLLLDPATDPYSPTQMRDEARRRNIRWLIVNTHPQLTADPVPNLQEYIQTLSADFTPVESIPGYTIYRRKIP